MSSSLHENSGNSLRSNAKTKKKTKKKTRRKTDKKPIKKAKKYDKSECNGDKAICLRKPDDRKSPEIYNLLGWGGCV